LVEVFGTQFLSSNRTRFFCQQAENDRKEVAAAITPLWVIRGDNIGVAGVTGSGGRQKGRLSLRKTAKFCDILEEED
jgi:hypothetical protein